MSYILHTMIIFVVDTVSSTLIHELKSFIEAFLKRVNIWVKQKLKVYFSIPYQAFNCCFH